MKATTSDGGAAYPRGRKVIAWAVAVILLVPALTLLERLPAFDEARDALRGRVEGDHRSTTRVERIVRSFRGGLPPARPHRPAALPSSRAMVGIDVAGELPVVSVVVDVGGLHDPRTGIVANRLSTGGDWERLAWASLFENGELVTGSAVGIRAHGDSSRLLEETMGFRLHFRSSYRTSGAIGARFLAMQGRAAATVLRNPLQRGAAVDSIAFDIGRRIGAMVPAFRPVRFYLDGEDRGIWTLSERVMPDGWGLSHFGHNDFLMYIPKGEVRPSDEHAYLRMVEEVRGVATLAAEEAATFIDLDNYVRHLLTLMFLGTSDWAQGAVVQDLRGEDRRWRWLLWDLDQSLGWRRNPDRDPAHQPVSETVFLRRSIPQLFEMGLLDDDVHIARHKQDLRRQLLLRLRGDLAFRHLFLEITSEVLNHRLTRDYMRSLPRRYAALAEGGLYSGVDLRAFLRQRPSVVRRDLARRFRAGVVSDVRVGVPAGVQVRIDGFPYDRDYRGDYFDGQTLSLVAEQTRGPRVVGWMVDGELRNGATLEVEARTGLAITPVLEEGSGTR